MKKLFVLILTLVISLGIVSCGNKVDVPDYNDFEEQVEMPINLSINDDSKTLTWGSVSGADGYAIYINGDKETEVEGTSYDFSGLSDNHIIFNVKALGPKGVADSQLSASIGYLSNRADEISAMELAIRNSDMYLNDEEAFAEELVNKGMMVSDFNAMMDEMDELNNMETPDSFSIGYNAISDALDSMDMYAIEAMISSLIKVELKAQLTEELDYYTERQQDYPWYDQQIEQTQGMLTFIEDHGDEAVRSVMVVIEYLFDVKEIMNEAMVADIDDLINDASSGTFDSSVFVTLKDDLVTQFKENLPPLEDVILLNMTIMTFAEAMSGDTISSVEISVAKQSASSLMSAELMFNFLLAIDEDYVDTVYDLANNPTLNNQKALVKETLGLYDTFLNDQEDLINAMDDLFTDEEKEAMFFQYYLMMNMNSMLNMSNIYFAPTYNNNVSVDIEAIANKYFDFDNILLVQNTMDETMNDVLDAIIESDYAVVDSIFDMIDYTYNNQGDESQLILAVINDVLDLLNPIIQDGDVETYNAMIDMVVSSLFINLETMYEMENVTSPDVDFDALYEIINGAVDETDDHQLNILKSLFTLLADSDYIEDFIYYYDISYDNENAGYGAMIVLANAFAEFYDESSSDIDAIIDEVVAVLNEEEVSALTELTSADISELETMITDYFTDLSNQADLIKDYDYDNLTTAQESNVEIFMSMISSIMSFGLGNSVPMY